MKKLYTLLLLLSTVSVTQLEAETTSKGVNYDLYGFVRADFFYNSRASFAPVNELFYMYPLDESIDPTGADINESATSGFFSFITRLGLNFDGVKFANADATAKIEIDFGGFGSYNTVLRIRQAYINLKWDSGSSLIIGQTWHPLFGDVFPYLNNISTGSPFQPFNRSPQLRYQYKIGSVRFTAAALCQLQYGSSGANGSSNEYQLDSGIPELYGGIDWISGGWLIGAGVDMLNITPRTVSVVGATEESAGVSYKVDERMSATSAEVHMRYHGDKFKFGAKSIYGSSLDHMLMLGGYGATSVSGENEELEYTPLHSSTSWVNLVYGKVWQSSLFVGYSKNLGTTEPLLSDATTYGFGLNSSGTDIDQLLGVTFGVTYNQPSWSVGVEYSSTTAWYGTLNLSTGRVNNTHDVMCHRVVAQVSYIF